MVVEGLNLGDLRANTQHRVHGAFDGVDLGRGQAHVEVIGIQRVVSKGSRSGMAGTHVSLANGHFDVL